MVNGWRLTHELSETVKMRGAYGEMFWIFLEEVGEVLRLRELPLYKL